MRAFVTVFHILFFLLVALVLVPSPASPIAVKRLFSRLFQVCDFSSSLATPTALSSTLFASLLRVKKAQSLSSVSICFPFLVSSFHSTHALT